MKKRKALLINKDNGFSKHFQNKQVMSEKHIKSLWLYRAVTSFWKTLKTIGAYTEVPIKMCALSRKISVSLHCPFYYVNQTKKELNFAKIEMIIWETGCVRYAMFGYRWENGAQNFTGNYIYYLGIQNVNFYS